jgi:hypothetical protein
MAGIIRKDLHVFASLCFERSSTIDIYPKRDVRHSTARLTPMRLPSYSDKVGEIVCYSAYHKESTICSRKPRLTIKTVL